jgi:hypothetical protein
MTSDPTFLLRQLSPAVLPAAVPAAAPHPTIDRQGFDELLAQARAGSLTSGRSLAVGFRPAESLTGSQLDRLAVAADMAEASGAKRALLLLDGKGLLLDVAARTLTGQLLDGAANVDVALFAGAKEGPLPMPGAVAPRGVTRHFEASGRSTGAA